MSSSDRKSKLPEWLNEQTYLHKEPMSWQRDSVNLTKLRRACPFARRLSLIKTELFRRRNLAYFERASPLTRQTRLQCSRTMASILTI